MKNTSYSVLLLAGFAGAVVCGCAHQPGDTNTPPTSPRDAASVQAPRDVSPADLSPGGGDSSDFIRPPNDRKEVAMPAPGPDYFWVHGYWNWNGATWDWVKGVWDKPTKPGAKWSEAHWVNNGGVITWQIGMWR